MRIRLPKVVNPETRTIIPSKQTTPSPARYNYPTDNPYFSRKSINTKTKEKRFFS